MPKYCKKVIKHTPPKIKHKHQYKQYLLKLNNTASGLVHFYPAQCCVICGKIGDVTYFETKPSTKHPCCSVLLSDEEILEKHKDLTIVEIHSRQDKYIVLSQISTNNPTE